MEFPHEPEEYLLSEHGDPIEVVASQRLLQIDDEMTGPVAIGHLEAEQAEGVGATVYYTRSGSYYSSFATIDLPKTDYFKGNSFFNALRDVCNTQTEQPTRIDNETFYLTKPDGLLTVVRWNPDVKNNGRHSGILIFPMVHKPPKHGSITPDMIHDADEQFDHNTTILEVGRTVATVANYAHVYSGADGYHGRLSIALPDEVSDSQVASAGARRLELVNSINSELTDFPSFEDFGGLDTEIARLRAVIRDMQIPLEKFAEYKLERSHGVLLVGPGGVGKTELAMAVAKQMGAKFEHVYVSDITSMWVGQAETNLRTLFTDSKEAAEESGKPVVLCFDEFDGLFSENAGGNAGSASSLIAEFKVLLTNIKQYPDVLVLGLANSTSGFDPALLRAGRFDTVINIPEPSQDARQKIFEKYLYKFSQHFDIMSFDNIPVVESEGTGDRQINSAELADAATDFTGADIKLVLQNLVRQKMHAEIDSGQQTPRIGHAAIIATITHHRRNRPSEA